MTAVRRHSFFASYFRKSVLLITFSASVSVASLFGNSPAAINVEIPWTNPQQ
jgi:hypothetical protein